MADPVTSLRNFRVWGWFQANEAQLIDFARDTYAVLVASGFQPGTHLSMDVAARIEAHVVRLSSLHLTLAREWPNHRKSQIVTAQRMCAVLVSELLSGPYYWTQLQAP
ncbi:MAG: hypothetical protein RIE74_14465 [Pseudomonadales bacterium]